LCCCRWPPTPPRYFKNAGYATAMIGKWHLGVKLPGRHPLDKGFDEHFGVNSAQTDYFESPILFDGRTKGPFFFLPMEHVDGVNLRQAMRAGEFTPSDSLALVQDICADIYSLGVVFHELLTCELPIGRFMPPSEKTPMDPRIDKVVMRALKKERKLRCQTVGDVKTGVEAITRISPEGENGSRRRVQRRTGAAPHAFNRTIRVTGFCVLCDLCGKIRSPIFNLPVPILMTHFGGAQSHPTIAALFPASGATLRGPATGSRRHHGASGRNLTVHGPHTTGGLLPRYAG